MLTLSTGRASLSSAMETKEHEGEGALESNEAIHRSKN
jgi:hypothetical protein